MGERNRDRIGRAKGVRDREGRGGERVMREERGMIGREKVCEGELDTERS